MLHTKVLMKFYRKNPGRLLTAIAAVALSFNVSAFQIHNEEYDFTVDIPDEFEPFDFLSVHSGKTLQFVKKNALHAFRKGGTTDNPDYTYIEIDRSSWIMVFDPMPEENPTITRTKLPRAWHGLDIKLYENKFGFYKNTYLITLTVVFPLRNGPVQISITGNHDQRGELTLLASQIVNSFTGDASMLVKMSGYSYLLIPLAFITFVIKRRRIG